MIKQNIGGNASGEKKFGGLDYLKITIFGFALTALWSSLGSILLPIRILAYVPEAQKNTYLGLLTFAGLIVAIIVQPIAGTFSDFPTHAGDADGPISCWECCFRLCCCRG